MSPNDDLIAAITRARFTPVRLMDGYAMDEVDLFLDDVVRALEAGEPVRPLVDGAQFSTTRWLEGYRASDVDALLARLRVAPVVEAPARTDAVATPADPAAAELVARVRGARFTPVRVSEGYDMAAVDRLLDDMVAAISAGRPAGPVIDRTPLPTTRWREGYDVADVDALLAELRGGSPPEGPRSSPPAAPAPSVVVEQRGILSRLLDRK